MQIYAYVALNFMLNLRNYANYAVCSHSAIMPESNAGIIGLAQATGITHTTKTIRTCTGYGLELGFI